MQNLDFWETLAKESSVEDLSADDGFFGEVSLSGPSVIDNFLGGQPLDGTHSEEVRGLLAKERSKVTLPVPVGTRVAFVPSHGALLSYQEFPEGTGEGTVVLVRTGSLGDTTSFNGKVFVLWDDGKMRAIHNGHLKLAGPNRKTARRFSIRTSTLGDIGSLFAQAGQDLVHKSTKDLWSLRKEGEDFVLERLFDESGAPLKV